MEQKCKVRECYMKGILVSVDISDDTRNRFGETRISADYILYSAMSHKSTEPIATIGPDDKVKVRHVSAFWAVMLAGRDHAHMVNMHAYMEEYKCMSPVPKHYGEVRLGSSMHVSVAFLTNDKDLAPGELLVLPFNAGLSQICCESFPTIP